MGYSGYSGYSGYPQLQNPRIGPAGKSPCEVARELRDQALVLASASTRSSTSSNSARLFGPALVFDVAGSPSLALTSARRRLLAQPHASPQRRLHARLPAAANGRHPCARGRRSRPPLACVCGRRSGQRARASTGRVRSESALRAPRSCDYVYVHTGRFQFETKRPICAIFSWLI
jgi:hypothetical protein